MAFLTKALTIVLIDERAGGDEIDVPLRGRDQGLRRLHERGEGSGPQAHRLLRGRQRAGPGRGGDAVEQLVPGVRLLVRQQHQHARGRLAPLGLQRRADRDAQPLRARQGGAEEGRVARGRGRARRSRRRHLGEAAGPAVRGADEDEAREPVGARPRRADGQPAARASSSRRTRRTGGRSSTRRSPPCAHGSPRARRAR